MQCYCLFQQLIWNWQIDDSEKTNKYFTNKKTKEKVIIELVLKSQKLVWQQKTCESEELQKNGTVWEEDRDNWPAFKNTWKKMNFHWKFIKKVEIVYIVMTKLPLLPYRFGHLSNFFLTHDWHFYEESSTSVAVVKFDLFLKKKQHKMYVVFSVLIEKSSRKKRIIY